MKFLTVWFPKKENFLLTATFMVSHPHKVLNELFHRLGDENLFDQSEPEVAAGKRKRILQILEIVFQISETIFQKEKNPELG